jgi:hypothetical protein
LILHQVPWHWARIAFLAPFQLELLKVHCVNLDELEMMSGGKAKADSPYSDQQNRLACFLDTALRNDWAMTGFKDTGFSGHQIHARRGS